MAAARSILPAVVALAAPAIAFAQDAEAAIVSRDLGGGVQARLIDISLDVLTAVGTSTAEVDGESSGEAIESLQGGAHDPDRRGFTFQQAEVSMAGAVDPYLKGEGHFIIAEDGLELEEAFAATTSLPADLQLKAGFFFTEFGRVNARHPHDWRWQDQPVIASRLMGGEGTRGPGARVSWLTPLPWYSAILVGVQNADHETMASFRGEAGGHHGEEVEGPETTIGGRPAADGLDVHSLADLLYLARWENAADVDRVTTKGGVSALYGPNRSGRDGETLIYGADVAVKWTAPDAIQGYPFVLIEAEAMKRDYDAAEGEFDPDDAVPGDEVALPGDRLEDWGFYAQGLWGFTRGWAAGLRYDYAAADGDSFSVDDAAFVDAADDEARNDRHRLSPLVIWNPSHFARIRLQYNYDRADHLVDDEAHSVWLGCEFLIGAHPAHRF
ncbi:MAG TPA: TonB-dependent receptor [Planctomycetota bacterium]|nr:TonB-dependent receptor [Planctomycetota bacterium]